MVQRHSLSERGHDLYETPPEAVQALLRVESIPHCIWEPAAGRGAIVRVLRDAGHAVISSDLVDYGFPLHFTADFLTQTAAPVGIECVLTNPPFKDAAKFVAKSLELCPRAFMLMRLTFYEAGELNHKRLDRHLRALVLDGGKLARIRVFYFRLPRMHRDQWAGNRATSQMAFAWYCFDANHSGPTTIDRIDWRLPATGEPVKSPISKEAVMAPRNIKAVEKTAALEETSAPLTITKPSGGFDLNKFKTKKTAAVANVETLPTSLPVHSMKEARDFVQIHPDETAYWSVELCFVNVPIKGQKHNTLHLIDEDIAVKFLESGDILHFRLALATKPDDTFFLCEIPTRNVDNSWNISNLEGCEKAKTLWTKATSRKAEGVESYRISFARDPQAFSKPKWPNQTLGELIERAFVGRIIDREDHPALLRKIGAKQPLA